MRKIKKYQEFTNEEINLKKAIAGAALGAGLAISNPSISQTDLQNTDKTEISYAKVERPNVTHSDSNQIKKMDGHISLDLSEYYDADELKEEDIYLHTSYLFNLGINKSTLPMGGYFFLHTPKVSFYSGFSYETSANITSDIDYDSGSWKDATGYYDGAGNYYGNDQYIQNMMNKYGGYIHSNSGLYQVGTWGNEYRGSATIMKQSKFTEVETKTKKNVFNIGLSKEVLNKYNVKLNAFAGLCLMTQKKTTTTNVDTETIKQDVYFAEDTWHVINPPSYLYTAVVSSSTKEESYKTVAYEQTFKIGANFGLMFDFGNDDLIKSGQYNNVSGLSLGISFDTSSNALNLLIGFNIK